ncbi:MAG: O-antigen ligase family protein [Chitinophagaceae bacterium]|jgi:O-antigen ligase
MPFINQQQHREQVLFISISLVLCTAIIGLKWYNSIAIIAFAAACVLIVYKQQFKAIPKQFFIITCCFFFLLHLVPFLMDVNASTWFETEKKLGFLILPLLMSIAVPLSKATLHKIMMLVCSSAAVLMILLFIISFSNYFNGADASIFFYHQLTAPVQHHAVYLSAYIGLCSFYLFFYISENQKPAALPVLLLGFLLLSIVMLSSKTIILVVFILLIWELRKRTFRFGKKKAALLMISMLALFVILITVTGNPLSKRFKELYVTDLRILSTDNYAPDMYFNAVQFRLVAWKFSWQIVKESNAFIFGVGPAHAQPALNEKYTKAKMFTGSVTNFNTGYLNMNAHNQFMQTFLQSGLLGVLILLLMLFYFFREAVTQKNKLLLYSMFLICAFFLSESVLEGQYGLVLFLFFPFLFFKHHRL